MRKECRQMSRPILHCCDIIFAFLRKQIKTKGPSIMKILNKPILAAVVALAPIMWCGQAVEQSLAPQFTLDSVPAAEIQAEDNFVLPLPTAAYAIPFRPTMDANTVSTSNQY